MSFIQQKLIWIRTHNFSCIIRHGILDIQSLVHTKKQEEYTRNYIRLRRLSNNSQTEYFRASYCPSILLGHGLSRPKYERLQENCFSTSRDNHSEVSKQANTQTELLSIMDNLDKLHTIPLKDVRNFCIIAHVDHGKSSLASRMLEFTGNLGRDKQLTAHRNDSSVNQVSDSLSLESVIAHIPELQSALKDSKEEITLLDTLKVERERGITVKASAASMLYCHPSATNENGLILLNMVDTPGHADFGMEVTKSLDSVEGAVLLFDSVQGVQAQTLNVYDKAKCFRRNKTINANEKEEGIQILPALTKIDIPFARPLEVALTISDLFGFDPDSIIKTSARARIGIHELINAICEKVPPPEPLSDDDGVILRAKVIDSWFEPRRGVICLVRVISGKLSEGDRISIVESSSDVSGHTVGKDNYSTQEVGIVAPDRVRTRSLTRGQMGYVIAGMRDPSDARPGTILTLQKTISKLIGGSMLLPSSTASGIMGQHSVLYASVHPMEGDAFDELQAAVERLALNDTGLEIQRTAGSSNNSSSVGGPFLGPGLRVGFQGLLHMEVFRQRLLDEFDLEALITPPKVPYTIQYHESKSFKRASSLPSEETIEDLAKWPEQGQRYSVLEPMIDLRILSPVEYAGNIMELIKKRRGVKMESKPIDDNTWLYTASMPWAEIVTDFNDELKTLSAGFASFDVSEADPPKQKADLCKVDILLNSEVVDPLSFVCHRDKASNEARVVCEKLEKVLPRQQFVIVIQAKVDGKIIASERIRAFRKDVLTTGGSKAVGGGDITRKKKLIEKQKRGKKRQQSTGKVTLSQEAFNSVISRSNN